MALQCALLDLPHELLHQILLNVDPADLARVRLTCTFLDRYLKKNELLFKELYLQSWDEPVENIPASIGPTWEKRLQNAVWLQKVLASDNANSKLNDYQRVVEFIVALLQVKDPTASKNLDFFDEVFDKLNLDTLICRSSLFEQAGDDAQVPADTEFERQLSAKLHCYYGIPIDPRGRKSRPTHPWARSRVYDLRNYDTNTMWGPFRPDGSGRVDWEKVEAIMIVLGFNMKVLVEESDVPFGSLWAVKFRGAVPYSAPHLKPNLDSGLDLPLEARDPYGVTGTWLRVVCFLDYHDFYAFNFGSLAPADGGPRPPIDIREAIRFIKLGISVTKIEPPGPNDGQGLPVVHFKGVLGNSKYLEPDIPDDFRYIGTVRLTREGEIRWTSFSIFQGEERWRSEGIQVGGLCTARGVLGTWFDKDFDPHGPAGPTAFWKTSNEVDPKIGEPEEDASL
ncbi:hypothetical protein TWF718_006536 [Orbilia javanica]|uniref:F-box domain-containing protein n=1 Tax=Orbilia javanica TaxID=47235 RepID=A0AAN8RCJ0_9PEZI